MSFERDRVMLSAASTGFVSRHRRKLIAIVGGFVFACATPPLDLYPAVFIGLGAYAWLLGDAPRARDAFALGWLWGTSAGLLGLRFVPSTIGRFTELGDVASLVALILLAAAQGLAWGLGGAAGALAKRRLGAPLELSTALATMVSVSAPAVIPWSPAGLLAPWPSLLQLAEVVGARGVSVLFAAWSAAVLRGAMVFVESKSQSSGASCRTLVTSILALSVIVVHGRVSVAAWSQPSPETVRLGLVQGATPPLDRWRPSNWPRLLSVLRRQTALAENAGIDLSIWPEAAYPYPLRHDTRAMPRGQREILGGAIDGPVLFGAITSAPPTRDVDGTTVQDTFNSATIVRRDRSLAPAVDKLELLWFGEAVPFGESIPWLRRQFQRSGGLRPGRELRTLTLERDGSTELRLGMFNCFEDTLPDYGRRIANELAPNLLVNVTNDAWFVGTAAPELHLRLATLRAIELRRDLVRSVNLGPSAWIDAAGRTVSVSREAEPGHLIVTPSLRDSPPTTYARFGDGITWLVIAAATFAAWQRRRRRVDAVHPKPSH